jgi:hypothetical protein
MRIKDPHEYWDEYCEQILLQNIVIQPSSEEDEEEETDED